MNDDWKKASGWVLVPKTAAGRSRHLEKVWHQRKRLQRELAAAKKKEVAIAAAVRADEEKVRVKHERTAGRMLLSILEEKRALMAAGDTRPKKNLGYRMERLDRVVTDPACREMAGLTAREPEEE